MWDATTELETDTPTLPCDTAHVELAPELNANALGSVKAMVSPDTSALVNMLMLTTTLPVAPAVVATGTSVRFVKPSAATVIADRVHADVRSFCVQAFFSVWTVIAPAD